MALWQWSTTPANNASAGAIDWAEGQPPSTVNDSARQMMADVATWFASPEWLNYGLTPTYVSATQFTVTGNKTSIYTVGRRVRAFVTAGIFYGSITASVFTSLTTITVSWDSGSLDGGISEVDVGINNASNTSLPNSSQSYAINGLSGTNRAIYFQTGGLNRWIVEADSTAEGGGTSGSNFEIISCTDAGAPGSVAMTITRLTNSAAFSGDLTAGGNITASSDERLKADWGVLPDDFIDRLAAVRSGTYTRIDTGHRHVGVGAQSLQALLPEAVIESEKGILSVAYGQAALAACVELAKEIVRLRAMLEPDK